MAYITTPYKVDLTRNGVLISSILVPRAGSWSLSEVDFLPEGAYTYVMTVTDQGNGRVSRATLVTVNLKR